MNNVAPQTMPPAQPRQGMSGCMKALLITAGLLVFAMLVMGFFVWRTVSWIQAAVTPTPSTVPPLVLSAGEKEDVTRILRGFHEAKTGGTEFDEYMTPAVFNGVMEEIFKSEKEKGNKKTPVYFRTSLDGENIKVQICAPADDTSQGDQYFSGEVAFQLDIENGAIKKAEIHSLSTNGREAPGVIMWFARTALQQQVEIQKTTVGSEANQWGVVKLLRREKDRLHLVLDGKKIKD